jgi:hypothetical protein
MPNNRKFHALHPRINPSIEIYYHNTIEKLIFFCLLENTNLRRRSTMKMHSIIHYSTIKLNSPKRTKLIELFLITISNIERRKKTSEYSQVVLSSNVCVLFLPSCNMTSFTKIFSCFFFFYFK